MDFLQNINWRLVLVGFVMALIFAVIVYVILIYVNSIKARKEAAAVRLPDLDKDKTEKKSNFKVPEELTVDVVVQEPELKDIEDEELDEKFLKQFAATVGVPVDLPSEQAELPDIDEVLGEVEEELAVEEEVEVEGEVEVEETSKEGEVDLNDDIDPELDALEQAIFSEPVEEMENKPKSVGEVQDISIEQVMNEESNDGEFDGMLDDILEDENNA